MPPHREFFPVKVFTGRQAGCDERCPTYMEEGGWREMPYVQEGRQLVTMFYVNYSSHNHVGSSTGTD